VARHDEWGPAAIHLELVSRVRAGRRELEQVEARLARPESGLGPLVRPSADARDQMKRSHEDLSAECRRLERALGRGATIPTVKEADDQLWVARSLRTRAEMLTAGMAEVAEAERVRAAVADAARQVTAAEEARARALEAARTAVRAAEASYGDAVDAARARLEEILSPGPGELLVGCGPLRLFATLMEAPAGRQPAAGLAMHLAAAHKLWAEHRERIADLLTVQAPEADRFRLALASRHGAPFILVTGRAGASLLPCPPGQERSVLAFAARVAEQAAEAAKAEAARLRQAEEVERHLDATVLDRSGIEAADAERARIDADPGLHGAIESARRRLAQARADTPELLEARGRLIELARRLAAPPAPLEAM
jgi:hypothetical protein